MHFVVGKGSCEGGAGVLSGFSYSFNAVFTGFLMMTSAVDRWRPPVR